ncbi:hypothetical protein Tco_1139334, partial [Tanacetum coccineum]
YSKESGNLRIRQNGIGGSSRIDILAVTRYAGCGGGVVADSSVSNGLVSLAYGV